MCDTMAEIAMLSEDDASRYSTHDGSNSEDVRTQNYPGIHAPADGIVHQQAKPNVTADRAFAGRVHKSRRRRRRADSIWSFSRRHIPCVEAERAENGRILWYCKQCPSYSVTSTSGARAHMAAVHLTVVPKEGARGVSKAKQTDIVKLLGQQRLKVEQETLDSEQRILRDAAKPEVVKAALLRLITRRNLPDNCVQWPELHTLIHSVNYMAADVLPTSHSTVAAAISNEFHLKQFKVREQLLKAITPIHLTTDTWTSPNDIELQAINAHYIGADLRLRKALIALVELEAGHSGEEVAKHVLHTMDWYGFNDRLGFITGDNHGANDTLCRAIAEAVPEWNPVDNRLRCLGHIINLAVQAFLFAKDEEAIDEAERQSQRSNRDIDEEIALASMKSKEGWSTVLPLQKLHGFCVALNRSASLKAAFKKLCKGRTIHSPNATRWNSWWFTITSAIALQFEMSSFVHDNSQLSDCELSQAEWRLLRDTEQFLQPFKEQTKRCEGDNVTLDQLQESMDFLIDHFERQFQRHRSNKPFIECITTGWYTMDKYYNKIDESGAYAAATLLHPNKRKAYLRAAWRSKWIKPGLRRAEELWTKKYEKYEKLEVNVHSSTTLPSNDNSRHADHTADVETDYERWRQSQYEKMNSGHLQSEFQRFIDSPVDNIKFTASYTVLDWWLEPSQQRTYPRLYHMAIDILSAPAMSAEAERVFSRARRTITFDREKLKGESVSQKECLKSWLINSLVDERLI